MLITTEEVTVQETLSNYYNTHMRLTIEKFRPKYEGKYHCTAKNSLGDITSQISVYSEYHIGIGHHQPDQHLL